MKKRTIFLVLLAILFLGCKKESLIEEFTELPLKAEFTVSDDTLYIGDTLFVTNQSEGYVRCLWTLAWNDTSNIEFHADQFNFTPTKVRNYTIMLKAYDSRGEYDYCEEDVVVLD